MGGEVPGPGHRYAIFLRGVNVGGVTIRMADLRDLLAGLPVQEVATVLASGNATCSSTLEAAQLRDRVEEALRARFGYQARVIVVEHSELAGIAASVPGQDSPATHSYVTLFTGPADRAAFVDEARSLGEDPVILAGAAIAWFPPKGRSTEVPLAKLLARTRHASNSTTRNINTVEKVLRLLG
ncbi:DUF1697 domain-containing protein [Arthrobacter sp. Ld5]|uniref:DUF1697 domain-containing protein n=1 Tax=Arthrobacter sp. Ld5 TaxID=649152 RepID=UPI003EB7F89E